MEKETKCIHAGYTPKNGESRMIPIVQSTTYKYESSDAMGDLFDLKAEGFFYTRLASPTVDALEKKVAAMAGGVAASGTNVMQYEATHSDAQLWQFVPNEDGTYSIYSK